MHFPRINDLVIDWSYQNTYMIAKAQPVDSHIHDSLEIYVNVSGDVSFMVENHVYAITFGDVILTRPNEYHHCIYKNDCVHEHFCIWIPVRGNEHLLGFWFKELKENLIRLPEEKKKKLVTTCYLLDKLEPAEDMILDRYYLFMQMLVMLKDLNEDHNTFGIASHIELPEKLTAVLDYINQNYMHIKSTAEVAKRFYISQTTLERLFKKHLNITPSSYIDMKRLAFAKRLLLQDKTVLEACLESGFPDYSHFIAKFKRQFGQTPLQYKKANKF